MASLTQLLAQHGSILLLDAASTQVQVGLFRPAKPALWRAGGSDAGTALFPLVEAALRDAGMRFAEVGAFAFCAGPGSMLGVRTVAMALRTWQSLQPRPAYAYLSLTLLAHAAARATPARPLAIVADARREAWHRVMVGADNAIGPLERVPSTAVAAPGTTLFRPTAFRAWGALPQPAQDLPYDLAPLFAAHADADLFSPAPAPDAFQHEAPEYRKWSAQVHSAASVPPR